VGLDVEMEGLKPNLPKLACKRVGQSAGHTDNKKSRSRSWNRSRSRSSRSKEQSNAFPFPDRLLAFQIPPPPSFGSVSLLPVNSIKLVSISFKILCSISALPTASAPASRKLMVLKLVPQTEWLPASLPPSWNFASCHRSPAPST